KQVRPRNGAVCNDHAIVDVGPDHVVSMLTHDTDQAVRAVSEGGDQRDRALRSAVAAPELWCMRTVVGDKYRVVADSRHLPVLPPDTRESSGRNVGDHRGPGQRP